MNQPKFFETKAAAEAAAAEWMAQVPTNWSFGETKSMFRAFKRPQKARDWVAPHLCVQTPDVIVEGTEWSAYGHESGRVVFAHWAAIWPKS